MLCIYTSLGGQLKVLLDLIKQHKKGANNGLYSVCSSHPLVLEAALKHALHSGEHVIIEATSNQVNQDGGYTGHTPADFYTLVCRLADKVGVSLDKVILGGDHLGPNCWQDLPAEEAMAKSEELIASYVKAGFRKIHLDCSMSCADDPVPIGDKAVAQRAARLCVIAEEAWKEVGGEPPVYIIGTEVPVPGGAQEGLDLLEVTSVDAANETIRVHYEAFTQEGLANVWQRIIGLVVQPGVEFDHHKIISFEPEKAITLSQYIESDEHMVFEAHSTDYQSTGHLRALEKLIENLNNSTPPLTMLSQYMPLQYQAVMEGTLSMDMREIIFHKVSYVLEQYSVACAPAVDVETKEV